MTASGAPRTRWNDLEAWQRAAVIAGVAAEIVLTTVALADLARRPSAQVRGPKAAWALGVFIQPIGPLLYLTAGRRS